MCSILSHLAGNSLDSILKTIPELTSKLSAESNRYFSRVLMISSKSFHIEDDRSFKFSLRQLMKKAVQVILDAPARKFTANNILAFGFQKSFESGDIQSLFPNHLHTHFLTETWNELHRIIGDDNFLNMLIECSIFVPISGGNNMLQICGKPFSEESSKVPSFNSSTCQKSLKFINRLRMLYGKATFRGTDQIINLPREHILNTGTVSDDLLREKFDLKIPNVKSWQFKRFKFLFLEFRRKHQKCSYKHIHDYYTNSSKAQLSIYQVYGFLIACLKRTLPKEFTSNTAFFKHLKKKLFAMLKMPRFEKLSVSELIYGLPLNLITIIFDPKHTGNLQSPSEHEKMKKLASSFIFFIFEHYIVELIRTNFYVTETSSSKNRLIFYRHDVWTRLTTPAIDTYQDRMLQSLSASSSMVKSSKLNPSSLSRARLRLVPKEAGKFRPIMAFAKPPNTDEGNRLRASFDVLKYFYDLNSGLSVFGFTGLQERLLKYKIKHKSNGPFYMAKMDITSCFDSIPHEKLFQLLSKMLAHREFSVRRVDQVQLDLINNRPIKRITRIARDANYNDLTLMSAYNSAVVIDRISGKFFSGEDIFRVIYEHISNNIVQVNGKWFKQKKGIPQGSFLSTLLCSLFYSEFDHESGLIDFPPEDLIMRYVDDFLIISPSRERLERLSEFLQTGFPEFGITINREKTLFSMQSTGKSFSWCGLKIDPQTLDISPDYSNFENTNIFDSITARERISKPGQALQRQLHYFLRPKLKKLFHQSNSLDCIVVNLIQSFAMVGIKLHSYLRNLPHFTIHSKFIEKCLVKVIKYCQKLVRLKGYPELVKSLAWNTFLKVLSRKGTLYDESGILRILKEHAKKTYQIPKDYIPIMNESLEPFFTKIKY